MVVNIYHLIESAHVKVGSGSGTTRHRIYDGAFEMMKWNIVHYSIW